ncbi:hypothetical protein GCM10022296_06100 [Secundilactobacillus similis DSM 23365 = JCM 2765]
MTNISLYYRILRRLKLELRLQILKISTVVGKCLLKLSIPVGGQVPAMGTGLSQKAVSALALKPR